MEWPGRAKSFVQIPRRAVPTLDALDALDAAPLPLHSSRLIQGT